MRRHTSAVIAAGLAAVLGILSVPHPASAQPQTCSSRTSPSHPTTRIHRCLAPSRPLFSRPICSRRFTEFDAKFKPSSVAISQSGKH